MIVNDVEFHNTGALEEVPGFGANGFMRIPVDVRNQLNERARFVGMDSVGCELRFVTSCPNVDVYFSYSKPEFAEKAEIRIFKGNFLCSTLQVDQGTTQSIRLTEPPAFNNTTPEAINQGGFASNVWRVCPGRGGTFVFHGVDAHGHDVRPPKPEEKPALKWLAYGSSITNSSLDGYPHFAARLLKIDVQNKGLSGACHCEKAMADWLADTCEWDVISCEMGINMRGFYSPEQFKERVEYLLKTLTTRHPDKPIIAINVFPNCLTKGYATKDTENENEIAYNRIVREVAAAIGSKNLHMIEGADILTEFTGLSGDLLHPSNFGHAIMGMNLAAKMRELLDLR